MKSIRKIRKNKTQVNIADIADGFLGIKK